MSARAAAVLAWSLAGLVLSGDLGVMKMTIGYDGNRICACEIVDFEDGKMKRSRAYFVESFEAPEWRAQW